MIKVTYEDKIKWLELSKAHPRGINDPTIISSIMVDVVKANSKGVRTSISDADEKKENSLYNACMGIYREFLKTRNSHLDMTGKKAKQNSEAMRGIITFMIGFAKSNGKPSSDESVIKGMQFLFNNWNRLNDFHRNRIKLPDIYANIEEILPMIRNGYDKKTNAKNQLDSLEQRIKNK